MHTVHEQMYARNEWDMLHHFIYYANYEHVLFTVS